MQAFQQNWAAKYLFTKVQSFRWEKELPTPALRDASGNRMRLDPS